MIVKNITSLKSKGKLSKLVGILLASCSLADPLSSSEFNTNIKPKYKI